ncbi:hypothetical protein BDZ89DRAFT_277008 [Hymenopellis radicata]|nr:hypothetical protein BDZ89DRAFT_277008 [Hymenopellis radicata]
MEGPIVCRALSLWLAYKCCPSRYCAFLQSTTIIQLLSEVFTAIIIMSSSTLLSVGHATDNHPTPPICLSVANDISIHSLPTELLLAIFSMVDEAEEGGAETAGVLSMKDKRWKLGRVCHRWREIVKGSPSLWIYFAVHLAVAAKLRNPAALLHHALSLTTSQGLHIVLNFNTRDADTLVAPAFTAMDLLVIFLAHAPRWYAIALTCLTTADWRALCKIVGSTTLMKLQQLCVFLRDDEEASDDEDDETLGVEDEENSGDEDEDDDEASSHEGAHDEMEPDGVLDAPLLDHLILIRTPFITGRFHPQLKVFILEDAIYEARLADLLQECTCLSILSVEEFEQRSDESDQSTKIRTRVTSSSLHSLALQMNVDDLDTVDLPKLITLEVGCMKLTPPAPYLPSIIGLIQYSHCPLRRLMLLNCDLAVGNLVEMLELIPQLQGLRIHFGHVEVNDEFTRNVDRALSSLTSALGEVNSDSETHVLVPDLEELRVDFFAAAASAFNWTFYSPKVKADFGVRQKRNAFTASCTFHSEPYFGITLPGSYLSWHHYTPPR